MVRGAFCTTLILNYPSFEGNFFSHITLGGLNTCQEGQQTNTQGTVQEFSNMTHVSRTPKKPEYLIALVTSLGVRW